MADSWRKAFEHWGNGQTRSGSIDSLVSAVRKGADVKVTYQLGGGGEDILWSRTLSSVTVTRTDIATVVSGVLTDIPDTTVNIGPLDNNAPGGTGGRTFEQPAAYEWQVFNTSGLRTVLKFDAATHQQSSSTSDNLSMAWFVRGAGWSIRDLLDSFRPATQTEPEVLSRTP